MDAFAAIGSLVISEGATAPVVLTTQNAPVEELPQHAAYTDQERDSADAVFTTHPRESDFSMPATLMVVSASVAALKSIAIDERKSADEQGDEEQKPRPGLPKRDREGD
jgi:hypothetical protein